MKQQLKIHAFRIAPEDLDRLKKVARRRGTTSSEFVRTLVERELDRVAILEQKKPA